MAITNIWVDYEKLKIGSLKKLDKDSHGTNPRSRGMDNGEARRKKLTNYNK
jgi:hypothetical protein